MVGKDKGDFKGRGKHIRVDINKYFSSKMKALTDGVIER